MNGYFFLIETLKSKIASEIPIINTTTMGLVDSLDLSKQTLFPLMHIVLIDATPKTNIVTFNLVIYTLDIVDKGDVNGLDNLNFVYNSMYNASLRLNESLLRGELWDAGLEVVSFKMTAVEQAYENYLAGWKIDLQIMIPNHNSIC